MFKKPLLIEVDLPPYHYRWYKKGFQVKIPKETIIRVSPTIDPEIEKQAKLGDVTALNKLGDIFFEKYDLEKARYWYKKAAQHGSSRAMTFIAKLFIYFSEDDNAEEKAIIWLKKAIKLGNDEAMKTLAWCYYNGEGVPENYARAFYWFKKAAELGNIDAMHALAHFYLDGEVEKDPVLGVYWLKKVAEEGVKEAMHDLANCYRDSLGIEGDVEEAFNWYQKAAEKGHPISRKQLRYFKKHGCFNKKLKW